VKIGDWLCGVLVAALLSKARKVIGPLQPLSDFVRYRTDPVAQPRKTSFRHLWRKSEKKDKNHN
jgi:hypothetical protein